MLLTKTRESAHTGADDKITAARPRLRRHAGATLPTMDRRAFLKRSGLVVGAGAFASQLPYNVIGKADYKDLGPGAEAVARYVARKMKDLPIHQGDQQADRMRSQDDPQV